MRLGKYKNGSYYVHLFDDGTKVRVAPDNTFIPEFAESCDMTITERCDGGCAWCYAGCSESGNHCDFDKYANLLNSLHPYTELAINGNDLSHPQLPKFLMQMEEKHVIVNMTINQFHFHKYFELVKAMVNNKLIHGLGISLRNANDIFVDKGYIGHKAAKMMKRSISAQNRKEKAIEEKSKLLKNLEVVDNLKINSLKNRSGHLIEVHNLKISYDNNDVVSNINFYLEDGDRLQLKGKNGSGKSSIIKLLLGDSINYQGNLHIQSGLKISYVSQETSHLSGKLNDFIKDNNIDEVLFKAILRKMDFEREQFEKYLDSYSEGQKKKVLLAKSICEQANIYIWDEPLNYIDIFSRMQIEDLIKRYNLTMIFVEHDEVFSNEIATKVIELK